MNQAAPCVWLLWGRGPLGDPLWTVLGPPKAGGGFPEDSPHSDWKKQDWLLFQRLWSPQENCQGDGPTEAGCQPLSLQSTMV